MAANALRATGSVIARGSRGMASLLDSTPVLAQLFVPRSIRLSEDRAEADSEKKSNPAHGAELAEAADETGSRAARKRGLHLQ
jgi:hypothetical protein